MKKGFTPTPKCLGRKFENKRLGFVREPSKSKSKSSWCGGFTLIELLIVIAIIAILAAVVFIALDPLTRFRDARDSRRWTDATSILSAIKLDQIDNGGSYLTAVTNMAANDIYMIGTATSGCTGNNTYCDSNVTSSCVDLTGLKTEGYMGSVPVSPNGVGTWSVAYSGYTLQKSSTGIITVRACESENSSEISVSR